MLSTNIVSCGHIVLCIVPSSQTRSWRYFDFLKDYNETYMPRYYIEHSSFSYYDEIYKNDILGCLKYYMLLKCWDSYFKSKVIILGLSIETPRKRKVTKQNKFSCLFSHPFFHLYCNQTFLMYFIFVWANVLRAYIIVASFAWSIFNVMLNKCFDIIHTWLNLYHINNLP